MHTSPNPHPQQEMLYSQIECIYKTNIASVFNSISGLKTPADEAAMPVILNQNWSKNNINKQSSSAEQSEL